MKVSIGISFLNSQATLADAVRSVFAQSFSDWELILIDDGSIDDSLAIAKSIRDSRVSVVHDGHNLGPSLRLDQITDLSRGQYVARMDADDLMHPLRIEKQVRWLDQHPEIDLLDTGLYTIDSQNQPRGIRGCHELRVTPDVCARQGLLNQPAILGRIEWMQRNRYDPSYRRAEDFELWCRAVANGDCRFARLAEPLLFYREEGSIRLRKMLLAQKCIRRGLRLHGPRLVGRARTMRYVLQSQLKSLAWVVASACGVASTIYRLRSSELRSDQACSVSTVIQEILGTTVPGLPG